RRAGVGVDRRRRQLGADRLPPAGRGLGRGADPAMIRVCARLSVFGRKAFGEGCMQSDVQTAPGSKGMLWTGRIMSAIPALFLLVDGVGKLVKPEPVVEATVRLGYPESVIVG